MIGAHFQELAQRRVLLEMQKLLLSQYDLLTFIPATVMAKDALANAMDEISSLIAQLPQEADNSSKP